MIRLDGRDARPIYEQVTDGLRQLVIRGGLAPGDKLPSVRVLAASLAINPNTIAKAYEALEAEGYLYTEPGRGTFAAAGPGPGEARRCALFRVFDTAAGELLFLGETVADLAARLEKTDKTREELEP